MKKEAILWCICLVVVLSIFTAGAWITSRNLLAELPEDQSGNIWVPKKHLAVHADTDIDYPDEAKIVSLSINQMEVLSKGREVMIVFNNKKAELEYWLTIDEVEFRTRVYYTFPRQWYFFNYRVGFDFDEETVTYYQPQKFFYVAFAGCIIMLFSSIMIAVLFYVKRKYQEEKETLDSD